MTGEGDLCEALARGELRVLAERQLERFAAAEPTLRAFAVADADAAGRALREDRTGPLAHVLFGAKDIYASADFPTAHGLEPAHAAAPSRDAWVIARARAAGAVLIGKTACTPFAYPLPPPTANPVDPARTPGGSSSGSAAAVGAGLVAFAFGSQTAGSTIRPASFCGVTGYKPSFGLLPVDGMTPLAPTLDHVGLFAQSPRDAWYVTSALIGPTAEILAPAPPRRVALLGLPEQAALSPDYGARLPGLAATLRDAGVAVDERPLPVGWDDFSSLQQRICYWEAARQLRDGAAGPMLPELAAQLEPHARMDAGAYFEARRLAAAQRAVFDAFAEPYQAVLLPAAPGPAPLRKDGTGDAVLNRYWTVMHVPAATVPLWRSGEGLPLGLQIVGRFGSDRALLAVAQWLLENTAPRA